MLADEFFHLSFGCVGHFFCAWTSRYGLRTHSHPVLVGLIDHVENVQAGPEFLSQQTCVFHCSYAQLGKVGWAENFVYFCHSAVLPDWAWNLSSEL